MDPSITILIIATTDQENYEKAWNINTVTHLNKLIFP